MKNEIVEEDINLIEIEEVAKEDRYNDSNYCVVRWADQDWNLDHYYQDVFVDTIMTDKGHATLQKIAVYLNGMIKEENFHHSLKDEEYHKDLSLLRIEADYWRERAKKNGHNGLYRTDWSKQERLTSDTNETEDESQ